MRQCGQCHFWHSIVEATGGTCRRYAPRPAFVKVGEASTLAVTWPWMQATDGCGEFAAYQGVRDMAKTGKGGHPPNPGNPGNPPYPGSPGHPPYPGKPGSKPGKAK